MCVPVCVCVCVYVCVFTIFHCTNTSCSIELYSNRIQSCTAINETMSKF